MIPSKVKILKGGLIIPEVLSQGCCAALQGNRGGIREPFPCNGLELSGLFPAREQTGNKTGTRQCTRAVRSAFADIHSTYPGALMHYLG